MAEAYNPFLVDDCYEDNEEEEVDMAEWNWGKKIIMVPNPWGRGVEESYDFDVTKSDKLFDFFAREGIDQVAQQSCYVASRSVKE